MPQQLQSVAILLKGGTIVNHDVSYIADVLIENGAIKQIGSDISCPDGTLVIDVTDQYLFPGGVDLDCHINSLNQDDSFVKSFASASQMAILGGTTTIVTTLNVPSGSTPMDCFDNFMISSNGNFSTDYAVCMKISEFNSQFANELSLLTKDKGVSQYIGQIDSNTDLDNPHKCVFMNEQEFCEFLNTCRCIGALPVLNADGSTILKNKLTNELLTSCSDVGPEVHLVTSRESAEANTIIRASLFAFCMGFSCPLLISRIHSLVALKRLVEQRRLWRGLVFGQTSVSAIAAAFASNEHKESKDWTMASSFVNPPHLSYDKTFGRKLLSHLACADLVSVGSGHEAVTMSVNEKLGLKHTQCISAAVAALGYRLIVLWHIGVEVESFMDPCLFVKVISSDPARVANLYPRKGRIAVGSDADIVVWNKNSYDSSFISSKLLPLGVPHIFSNFHYKSGPQYVLLRGHVVVDNQHFCESVSNIGQFLPTKPFAQYVYSRVANVEQDAKSEIKTVIRDPYVGSSISSATVPENILTENYYLRKEHYDNLPKVALPPGQRKVHTSVKTAQPPGGSSHAFWLGD